MTRGESIYHTDECQGDHQNNGDQFTDDDGIGNPRQASPQSRKGGQTSATEDTNKEDCNAADVFVNPMYAAGVLPQDDRGQSACSFRDKETNEINSNTNKIHDDHGNDVYHCINDDEINNQQQDAQQSPHGGQPSAEDADDHQSRHLEQPSAENADDRGRNSLFDNPMYATGASRQDDGDGNDAADSCGFPRSFHATFHRYKLLIVIIIAMVVAAAIGAGASLVTFLTTVQKARPLSSSSLEWSGTSSRPFPATPTAGSTLEAILVFQHNTQGTRFHMVQKATTKQPLTTHKEVWYQRLGCWKDDPNRAIPSLEGTDPRLDDGYGARHNAIEKCSQVAHSRGFTVFAVQYGGQCYGSDDGHNTYSKYGRSSACGVDGKGGTWANEVYQIGVNVALGKTAFQTSTLDANDGSGVPSGIPSLAVDGETATHYYDNSCTHTSWPAEDNPTWWVDLGQPHVIVRVVIFNRLDCCSERLNPFNIHIGDSDQVSTNPMCGGDHQINLNQPSISVSCQGMKGHYVGVRLPGSSRVLTLCEVQVLAVRASKWDQ
uniref:Fucolectin tachylectin-4 pentraxin-1 domain-containing protein n=1 Tax=Branchiostoma floridae TaxID=7739 RepID=C3ZNG4_BRAFL|eukprot:XP_002589906.1 hypothetical protein BRAFLDRAFT_81966 [Branchiostoma floridae]